MTPILFFGILNDPLQVPSRLMIPMLFHYALGLIYEPYVHHAHLQVLSVLLMRNAIYLGLK